MTPPTRILLVDDHTLFRESLHRLLDAEPGLHVCASFATAEDAFLAIQRGLACDVALIDFELTLSAGTGLDLLHQLRSAHPALPALIVTAGMEVAELQRLIADGKTGIFLKTEPTAELLLAIQRTAHGERWISSGAVLNLLAANDKPAPPQPAQNVLTPRESRVLRGILEGLSNKEIGARLELTESSVKAVIQKLFEKAGVRSRSQLVRYAIEAQVDPQ